MTFLGKRKEKQAEKSHEKQRENPHRPQGTGTVKQPFSPLKDLKNVESVNQI